MAKRKKYDKDCWDLMEFITGTIRGRKVNGKGYYEFKKGYKKKDIKSIRRICPHWIIDEKKNRAVQAVRLIYDKNGRPTGNVYCAVCHAEFPLMPYTDPYRYVSEVEDTLALVNQIEYWDFYAGGSKENLKMFDALRKYLPRFAKVAGRVSKAYQHKDKMEQTIEAEKNGLGFKFHTGSWTETDQD